MFRKTMLCMLAIAALASSAASTANADDCIYVTAVVERLHMAAPFYNGGGGNVMVRCGAALPVHATAIASIIIRMCTTHKTSTATNTTAAATACTIATRPRCRSRFTTRAGTTSIQANDVITGAITS